MKFQALNEPYRKKGDPPLVGHWEYRDREGNLIDQDKSLHELSKRSPGGITLTFVEEKAATTDELDRWESEGGNGQSKGGCICTECSGCPDGWCEGCTPDIESAGHGRGCPLQEGGR
jgi:hypothetical protein